MLKVRKTNKRSLNRSKAVVEAVNKFLQEQKIRSRLKGNELKKLVDRISTANDPEHEVALILFASASKLKRMTTALFIRTAVKVVRERTLKKLYTLLCPLCAAGIEAHRIPGLKWRHDVGDLQIPCIASNIREEIG